MNLSPEELNDVKEVLQFLVKKKSEATGGHGGFSPKNLEPILENMEKEGLIKSRPTINGIGYFNREME